MLVWVSQLRPRVTAYTGHLKLQGPLRDTLVPYVLIDEVTMAQTLNVWVGERRFVCIGIGRSLGSDMRQRGEGRAAGLAAGKSRSREFSDKAEVAAPDQTAMSYHTFVVTRIEELVDQAKRDLARQRRQHRGCTGAPAVRRARDRRAGGDGTRLRGQPVGLAAGPGTPQREICWSAQELPSGSLK